jgi:hypothetical protein
MSFFTLSPDHPATKSTNHEGRAYGNNLKRGYNSRPQPILA